MFCFCNKSEEVYKNKAYLIIDFYPSRNINPFSIFIDFSSKIIIVKNKNPLNDKFLKVKDNILNFSSQDEISQLSGLIYNNDFCSKTNDFNDIIDGVLVSFAFYDDNKIISCEKFNYSESEVKIIKTILEYLIKNDKKNSTNLILFYN